MSKDRKDEERVEERWAKKRDQMGRERPRKRKRNRKRKRERGNRGRGLKEIERGRRVI